MLNIEEEFKTEEQELMQAVNDQHLSSGIDTPSFKNGGIGEQG